MKVFTLILPIVLIAITMTVKADQINEQLLRNSLECLPEIPLKEEDLQKILRRDFANSSQEQKCFIKCVMDKGKFLKNGELDEDAIRAVLRKDHAKEWIDRLLGGCHYTKSDNECESAFKVVECYQEQLKKLSKI